MARVLVVYASFGEGHKKAAQALSEALNTSVSDLLDFSSPFIKKIYSFSYIAVSRYLPYFWQLIFLLTKVNSFSSLITKLHRIIFSSFFSYLRANRPQIVVTTHFFPAHLIAYIKKELNCTLISVITDLRVHPLWVHRDIDCYFVALNVTGGDLITLGVTKEKIITGFIPIRKNFSKSFSPEYLYKQFSLNQRPGLLFVSSLQGIFPLLKKVIEPLLKDFNIFVIYGKNQKLKYYLESLKSPYLRFFSFYENIEELMSLSSVIITKPGGVTIFEGMYKRKPFIFTHYIPGQEKENMEILIRANIAKFVQEKQDLIKAVKYFQQHQKQLGQNYPFEVKDIRLILADIVQRYSQEKPN